MNHRPLSMEVTILPTDTNENFIHTCLDLINARVQSFFSYLDPRVTKYECKFITSLTDVATNSAINEKYLALSKLSLNLIK